MSPLRTRALRPLLGLVFLVAVGCQKSPPNVLVVTFDTTRADSVGYASGRADLTPTLDALAADGTWFSTCLASQPITLPSHATIFTGLYPPKHGARNNGSHVLGGDNLTLAERLSKVGYQTHAIVSSFVLDSRFGLDQGFDEYDDDLTAGEETRRQVDRELPASVVADKAIEWIRSKLEPERPFFLWLHFYDAHYPYDPPKDIRTRFADQPYLGEIHFADRELSRVLAELKGKGLMDDTITVVSGDHGEAFGEHGEKTHGIFIYETTTRVPLLFSGPGVPKGKRVDGVTRTADITPTILELLELPSPSGTDGESLVSMWNGRVESRTAYMETTLPRFDFGWSEMRALRDANTKVIHAPRPEAYDLTRDRNESENLFDVDPPSHVRRLLTELRGIEESDPLSRGEQVGVELDRETRERLASLGYLGGGDARTNVERADPKDRIVFWEKFRVAQASAKRGEHAKAVAYLEGLLEEDPESVSVMAKLASSLSRIGRTNRALDMLQRIYSIDPSRVSALTKAAEIHRKRRELEEAEVLVRAAIAQQPKNPEGYVGLAQLHIVRRDYAEAERVLRDALEIEPESPDLRSTLGSVLHRQGELAEAASVLRATLRQFPDHHWSTYNLGVVVEAMGQADAARDLYRKAVRLDPEDSRSWNNLGSSLDRAGRREDAIKAVARAARLDPSNFEAVFNLGVLLVETGRFAQAMEALDRAVTLRPAEPRAHWYRGRAMDGAGRLTEAVDEYLIAASAAARSGDERLAAEIVKGLLADGRVTRDRVASVEGLGAIAGAS